MKKILMLVIITICFSAHARDQNGDTGTFDVDTDEVSEEQPDVEQEVQEPESTEGSVQEDTGTFN